MIKKISTFLASLVLLITSFAPAALPTLASTPDAYAAQPSQGEVLGLGDAIGNFVRRVWEATPLAQVTNVDILVRNFVVALLNSTSMVLAGVPFTDLTEEHVAMMRNGEWNVGLAFAGATVIDGAYIDPPGLNGLHLASYLKYELSDNLLTQRVYAQTTGEKILDPVVGIWESIKNATYGLFMLIMIAIGFMIMLRKQIAPRVVVSFTNALPRIVAGLFLITFSFLLIALIFDVVGVFASKLLLSTLSSTLSDLPPGEIITFHGQGLVGKVLGTGAAQLLGESLATIFSTFDLYTADKWQALQAFFVFVIFLVLLFFAFFAVALQLLFRIAKLLIKTVLAPFVILFGSLPGQEGSITTFVKGIIADCAAFPAIAFMFGITRLFLRKAVSTEPFGAPPLAEMGLEDIIPTVYSGVALLFLIIVFMVMTMAAPMFVGKILEPKTKK